MFDVYRLLSRGQYLNDFSFLNSNSPFPNAEAAGRNAVYKFRHKEYSGEYSYNKKLLARIDGVNQEIDYQVIGLNYFQLTVEKLTDIIFNNDISIKSGDIETDKLIENLVERTDWKNSIRSGFKKALIYGDAGLRVYKGGVSPINPQNICKIVDVHDVNNVLAYVLYQPLVENKQVRYMRFEIHFKGQIYECVKQYNSVLGLGNIGGSVDYNYRGRKIPKSGIWYNTNIDDCELVQMLCVNKETDGVYGESVFQIIQPIVFALEQRLSVHNALLDSSIQPFLVVGIDSVETYVDEKTGREERRLKLINGQFLVSSGEGEPKAVELNYNLDNSKVMLDVLKDYLYELSEMSMSFMTGQYQGNISEETLQNTMKSVLDKANRYLSECYNSIVNSLYCLCRLNDINVNREQLMVSFNLGQIDSDETIANVSKTLIESGILSRKTIRERYFGYNSEMSKAEDTQIRIENNGENGVEPVPQQSDDIDENNNKLINSNGENEGIVDNKGKSQDT